MKKPDQVRSAIHITFGMFVSMPYEIIYSLLLSICLAINALQAVSFRQGFVTLQIFYIMSYIYSWNEFPAKLIVLIFLFLFHGPS